MLFKTWIWSYIKRVSIKTEGSDFFFRHKELLCYRMQWIMFSVIGTNKYFKLSIWLLVKSCKLLANVKIIQTDYDEFCPRIKGTVAGIKTRTRILLLHLSVEGNDEGQGFAIYSFSPTEGGSFKVSKWVWYGSFSFSCQSFVQKNQYSGLRKYQWKCLPSVGQ